MKHIRKLAALSLVVMLVACSRAKDNSEPPAPLTDIDEALEFALDWKLDTRASSNDAAYRLRPLLVGDRIYSIDTGGSINSINAGNGERNWRFDTGLAAIAGLGGNRDIIVATSQDGDIAAYQPGQEGLKLLWKIRINSEIRAIPVVDGPQVFVRSVDGKLRSLAVADGSLQWVISRRVPALSLTGNSAPVVQGELVFAGFDDGKLLALDRVSGQTAWEATVSLPRGRTEVERLVDLDANFILRDGVIYVVSFQGRLAAIQALSGDLLWSRAFSSFQSIAIDDEALYLSADDSDLWSIDRKTGTAFWKQDVLHARKITAPAIIDDRVVVADFEGYLHWFAKSDGRLLGRVRPGSARSYVQPQVWKNSALSIDKDGLLSSVSLKNN